MPNSVLHITPFSIADNVVLSSTPLPYGNTPVSNLQSQNKSIFTTFYDSPNPIYITGSDAAGFYVNSFAIAGHTLLEDCTIRLRCFSGVDGTGTTLYDSGHVSVTNTVLGLKFIGTNTVGASAGIPDILALYFDNDALTKSFELWIVNPTGETVSISRLFLGYAFTAAINISYGATIEWVDNSKHIRTSGGSMRTISERPYRRFELSYDWLTDAEQDQLNWLMERRGKTGDVLVSLNPNLTDRQFVESCMIGKRASNSKFARKSYGVNATKLIFEET